MPSVAMSVSYVDGVTGGNVFLLNLEGARALAASMMGMEAPEDPDAWRVIAYLTAPEQMLERAEAVGYAAQFDAVARELPWRPVLADATGALLNPRPTAPGYQTAIVVDGEGSHTPASAQEVHCDRLGRIRVRFHFMGDAGADTARASCWLRVPADRIGRKISHHEPAKTTIASNTPMGRTY